MENIEVKNKVGRPKGSKNKVGVKTGRPKGSTKPLEDIRNKNFNVQISSNEEKLLNKIINLKEFKGKSKRFIFIELIKYKLNINV